MKDKPVRLRVALEKIKMLCERDDYIKHHHGIKYTRIYFKNSKYCKVNCFGRVEWYENK